MKKILFAFVGILLCPIIYCQDLSMLAGDTIGLSQHHRFNPPLHIERVGAGDPIEYKLDINLDGFNDISIKCGNSYGALGYSHNYITVQALDSNSVCYARIDSIYCSLGYNIHYLIKFFNANDTINNQLTFSPYKIIINEEDWSMGNPCPGFSFENVGVKYFAVKLNSHGINGLAWINLELYKINVNGYSADVIETGFKSATSSISENIFPEVLVYPNPSSGLINIYIPEMMGNMTAYIFDLLGNEILAISLDKKNSELSLAKGTYILKISDKRQRLLVKKVMVL